ncbi:MAG: hypothetical protein GY793_03920 [Proteobacteria bacterium]|nr:hypothetical protein [Pseudomonadota bacterium]
MSLKKLQSWVIVFISILFVIFVIVYGVKNDPKQAVAGVFLDPAKAIKFITDRPDGEWVIYKKDGEFTVIPKAYVDAMSDG